VENIRGRVGEPVKRREEQDQNRDEQGDRLPEVALLPIPELKELIVKVDCLRIGL
tara:strand:- start:222 stop:386 length:165 start_codon:yes stop_codon:yes gene_type:complete